MTHRRLDIRIAEQLRPAGAPEHRPAEPAAWLRCSAAVELPELRRIVAELEAIPHRDNEDRADLLLARAELEVAERIVREGVPGWEEMQSRHGTKMPRGWKPKAV